MDQDAYFAAGVCAHSEAVLEQIYTSYSPRCFSLACRLLVDRHLAEDVLQDVFLSFWKRPEGYRPERGSLLNWLLAVTHNKCVDRIRREERTRTDEVPDAMLELVPDQSVGPVDVAIRHDEAGRVAAALRALPANQQLVLRLAYYGGYSQSDIADITSIPLGTVKSRTLYGMKRLAQALGELQPHDRRLAATGQLVGSSSGSVSGSM